MTKKRFNNIRSRLEMRLKNQDHYKPRNKVEEFVVEIIESKHKLDKEVEYYYWRNKNEKEDFFNFSFNDDWICSIR